MSSTSATVINLVQIPLFPLRTVLFPGGPLPLRIFEARYLDMVSECLKTDCGFGVCLIQQGREVGEAATPFETGCLAKIVDWHKRHDGLLGITAIGAQRFKIASTQVKPNQLMVAKVELLPSEPTAHVPDKYLPLVDLLRRLMDEAGHHYATIPTKFADAAWVSYRLSELLPISISKKQALLEMPECITRLESLYEMLEGLEIA